MSEYQLITEELGDLKFKAQYTADPEMVKNKYQQAVSELRKANVPGFRPGKATDQAIKVRFKDRIHQWVTAEMVKQANDDVLYETKARPLGRAKIESAQLSGNTFKLEAVFSKKPEITLAAYKELELSEPILDQSVASIKEEFLKDLLTKHGESHPFADNESVQMGDKLVIDVELSSGFKEEGKLYNVGENLYESFDQNILDMKVGDVKEFELTVDSAAVTCKVTLHMGLKDRAAELTDEIAVKCGVEKAEDVLNSLQVIAENRIQGIRNAKIAEALRAKLLETHEFEVPNWLVTVEAEHLASRQGLKYSEINDETRDHIRSQARDSVKFTLILDAIRQTEPETELSDQEALEAVKQTLLQRGVSDVDAYLQRSFKDGSLLGFLETVRTDYVVQWLINNVKVS